MRGVDELREKVAWVRVRVRKRKGLWKDDADGLAECWKRHCTDPGLHRTQAEPAASVSSVRTRTHQNPALGSNRILTT